MLENEAADLDLPEDLCAEALSMAREVLKSDTIKRALKSDAYYKEVPFAVKDGSSLLEGKIDVLFAEGDAVYLVDFKTDRVAGKDVKARAEHYRPQAEAYARAVRTATGTRALQSMFFFLYPREAVLTRQSP